MIESRKGHRGAFFHTLTDKGWAECRQLSTQPRPAGPRSAVGALMALLGGVQHGLDQRHISHGDFFRRETNPAASETSPAADVPSQIRAAYVVLAGPSGGFVTLADLRDRLADVSREDFDDALRGMNREADVHLQPAANLKALDERERDAAMRLGGEDTHILAIENS